MAPDSKTIFCKDKLTSLMDRSLGTEKNIYILTVSLSIIFPDLKLSTTGIPFPFSYTHSLYPHPEKKKG